MNHFQVGLILLAAGESKRMGTPKQLLSYKRQSLIRHAATEAVGSNCRPIVVVLGANCDRILSELKDLPINISYNFQWHKGMSASISVGIQTLMTIKPNIDAVIIALADQPLIVAQVYDRLLERYQKQQLNGNTAAEIAIASTYSKTFGVPALFNHSLFSKLLDLNHRGGAKQLLKQYSNPQYNLDLPEAAIDIDTPADYQKLTKL